MNEKKESLNSFSFRWGGTGTDMKIYFEDATDLMDQLAQLDTVAVEARKSLDRFKSKMVGGSE